MQTHLNYAIAIGRQQATIAATPCGTRSQLMQHRALSADQAQAGRHPAATFPETPLYAGQQVLVQRQRTAHAAQRRMCCCSNSRHVPSCQISKGACSTGQRRACPPKAQRACGMCQTIQIWHAPSCHTIKERPCSTRSESAARTGLRALIKPNLAGAQLLKPQKRPCRTGQPVCVEQSTR